jgi:hypothetical protein
MKVPICFLLIVNNVSACGMTYLPPQGEFKEAKVIQVDEVFTPINKYEDDSPPFGAHRKKINSTAGEIAGPTIFDDMDDKNIILDINDPLVQEIIKRIVSTSIHEAFRNKQLQKELAEKKKCCTSSTKLKIALLTAMSSTATAVLTIILNNM